MLSYLPKERRALIGVVHLPALPGSPRHTLSLSAILAQAVADAQAYAQGGADALIVENFGDAPFARGRVASETVAAMALAVHAVRAQVRLPVGVNVLRNDARSALGICAATSCCARARSWRRVPQFGPMCMSSTRPPCRAKRSPRQPKSSWDGRLPMQSW
jgi:membrane complex biogenesis BtpA family protein